jgi:26S proteasome regulatory subunit N9
LEEKIRTMAFLDLLFNLPKNARTVSFDVISNKTSVSKNDVELLIMRAMSLGLVKGSID